MAMDQILTGPRAPRPSESATATARHVCAAGAGNWSVPSALASGTRSRKHSTLTSVPTKMPANCAMNCLRGCAPSR